MNYCSAYFQYVKVKIHLLNKELENDSSDEHLMLKKLESIIKNHRKAIYFAEKLDDITNVMSFLNFFVNIFLVCFLMFNFGIVRI
jgi:hypothetical protein